MTYMVVRPSEKMHHYSVDLDGTWLDTGIRAVQLKQVTLKALNMYLIVTDHALNST